MRARSRSPIRTQSPDRRMRGDEDEDDRDERRRRADFNLMREQADRLMAIERRDYPMMEFLMARRSGDRASGSDERAGGN